MMRTEGKRFRKRMLVIIGVTLGIAGLVAVKTTASKPVRRVVLDAPTERVMSAVRQAMKVYRSAREVGDLFETDWEDEPLAAAGTEWPSFVKHLMVRYKVRVRGSQVEISAEAQVHKSYPGTKSRWERIDPRPLEERLLTLIKQSL